MKRIFSPFTKYSKKGKVKGVRWGNVAGASVIGGVVTANVLPRRRVTVY